MTVIDTFEACLKEADGNWIKRSRKMNTSALVKGVVATGLSNVGLRQYCKQHTFVSASAISRARKRIPTQVLSAALQSFINMNIDTSVPRFFAIDSTKIQLPKCFIKEGVLPRNSSACKPLLMCSTLFDVKKDVPCHIDVVTHHNERKSLTDSHMNVLRYGDTVIADRGYYSAEVCRQLTSNKIGLLFRVKEKASSEILKFTTSRRRERVIDQGGIKLKCFKYSIGAERYVLVASDIHMTLAKARALYKTRWRVEEGFRRWKSDFLITKNTPKRLHEFRVHLHCICIGHAVTRFLVDANKVISYTRLDKSDDITYEHIALPAFKPYALALFANPVTKMRNSGIELTCVTIHTRRVVI